MGKTRTEWRDWENIKSSVLEMLCLKYSLDIHVSLSNRFREEAETEEMLRAISAYLEKLKL